MERQPQPGGAQPFIRSSNVAPVTQLLQMDIWIFIPCWHGQFIKAHVKSVRNGGRGRGRMIRKLDLLVTSAGATISATHLPCALEVA